MARSDPAGPWAALGLSRPAQRALINAGYASLEALADVPRAKIAALHGMGPTGVERLKAALAAKGLSLSA